MADSVTGNLLNGGAPKTSLCDLPTEMLWNIFEHSNLVSLMCLAATCSALRYQVHEIFTARIEAQAHKYPEVKQSLDRLGWNKKHNFWGCKCFKLMAGPGFTWAELEEKRSISAVVNVYEAFAVTAAEKTFFVTSSREGTFALMVTGEEIGHNSLQTLASFNNDVFAVALASYDNVLAVILKKYLENRVTISVCIFNASTLAKVSEMNLCPNEENGDVVFIEDFALTRDTMVVHLNYLDIAQMEGETKIQIWKINTQDSQEEGIGLLSVMSHDTALLSKDIRHGYTSIFCINDRFVVIFDVVVKVFGRSEENPLICQIEIGNNTLFRGIDMQEREGDHIALALKSVNAENVPKITVNVYSASRGHLIIQKEMNPSPALHAPIYMKWFGDHLIVASQQGNELSFFSWQPGLATFLSFPCGVPVVRRSPRGNRGGTTTWAANCINVDFQGITAAVLNQNFGSIFEKMVYFKTWKSSP